MGGNDDCNRKESLARLFMVGANFCRLFLVDLILGGWCDGWKFNVGASDKHDTPFTVFTASLRWANWADPCIQEDNIASGGRWS